MMRTLADAIWPQACFGCGRTLYAAAPPWCGECLHALLGETAEPYCPTCARTTAPYEVIDGRCRHCGRETFRHAGLVRVAPYTGRMRDLIRGYKFGGQQRLDQALGRLLASAIEGAPWRGELEAVVPVPSHWTVRRRRGFFSTGRLAEETASALRLPYVNLLTRPKRGRSQVGLSPQARHQNVRGMFALRRGASVDGRVLCLVDDVMVTGATLTENARMLRGAGAAAVYAAVLARPDLTDGTGVDV